MTVLDFPSSDLSRELAIKYGYDEFMVRRWLAFFGEDARQIIEAMERGVPKYIRVNTIKTGEDELVERLEKRGFELEKTEVPYCYEIVEEPFSVGATPEYLMGYYYVMDKSSCIPPLELDPKPDELVVDFAASPGGKTTFMAQLMSNRGKILALEANPERIQPLVDNIHRMGVLNTAVIRMNAARFHQLGIKADKILLDAPCTGEGIIHKDPSRKTSRGEEDIEFCSSLQTELLRSAILSLRPGGTVVYSTCSMTPEENELVVSRIMKEFHVHLEEVGYGDNALTEVAGLKLNPELRKAKRLFPHRHSCSGFFIAKIVRDGG